MAKRKLAAEESAPPSEVDLDEIVDRREVPALKWHPRVLGADGADLFPASVADMDFKAPPAVRDALRRRLDHGVFGYEAKPDGLLQSLSQWLEARHGWRVEEDHVLHSPNILNALAMAAGLFTQEGDGVIMQPPVYMDFFDVLNENRRRIVRNPLVLKDGHYRMDLEDLEQKAADPRTTMLFLCNPHNPVGRVWSEAELRALGEICARHNVLVVSDDMHADIVFAGHRYIPFAGLGPEFMCRSITCLSPAKAFNIAACCSSFTLIPDEAMRKRFQAENSKLTVNKNNAFANVAMEAAYRHGGPWLDTVMAYLEGNVKLIREKLKVIHGVTLIEPQGSFLLWLDFRALGLAPADLTEFLREKARWAASRGHAFGEEGSGFARVNVACTRVRLEAALEQLRVAIEGLRN